MEQEIKNTLKQLRYGNRGGNMHTKTREEDARERKPAQHSSPRPSEGSRENLRRKFARRTAGSLPTPFGSARTPRGGRPARAGTPIAGHRHRPWPAANSSAASSPAAGQPRRLAPALCPGQAGSVPWGRPAVAPRRRAGQGRAGGGSGRPQHVCRSPPARSMRPTRCITPPCPLRMGHGEGKRGGEEGSYSHRPTWRIWCLSSGSRRRRRAWAEERAPLAVPRPFAQHWRALPQSGEAAGSGRLSRNAGAPETAPGERPGAALGAPGAGREAAAQAARGFTGAEGETWRGSGRGEPCSGTSSIYSRLATHAHARPLSLTHTRTQGHGASGAARSAPFPPAPPSSPPGSAPEVPPAEVSGAAAPPAGGTRRGGRAKGLEPRWAGRLPPGPCPGPPAPGSYYHRTAGPVSPLGVPRREKDNGETRENALREDLPEKGAKVFVALVLRRDAAKEQLREGWAHGMPRAILGNSYRKSKAEGQRSAYKVMNGMPKEERIKERGTYKSHQIMMLWIHRNCFTKAFCSHKVKGHPQNKGTWSQFSFRYTKRKRHKTVKCPPTQQSPKSRVSKE